MLQQTTVEKAEKRFGFLDNLFEDSNGKGELKKDTDFLSDDYAAAIRIAANLSSNAKWIPYPFLQNRIRKIADEMRTQSELFRSKISELGGQLPQVAVDNRDLLEFRQNVKRLVKDMEEHAAQSEALTHQKNKITDESVKELISAVIVDMQRQKDELIDIVMRLS
ncbi:MAG: hypothetical protein M1470_13330 [Bacteroidetes bacterium]|nr:hypothetical protein [Bacteroidota bacterium]MCL5738411.1 hypothetical protein [Bacteroidota bacterium]